MKYSLTLMFAAALLGVICAQAEDVLPPRFTYDRYSKMVDNSPFAIATAVAVPAATPDFAKDLYVANAARSPDGDLVTIASTSDHNFKKYLTTKGSVDGYSIADIEWSERVGATKVTISKDGNFATITFNQALLQQSAPNTALAARTLAPPAPNLPSPNVPLPANVPPEMQKVVPPSREVRNPHSRGLIQRNPRGASKSPGMAPGAKN
ncbi:MAG TPA: hypothetical protein VFO22_07380 [Candidatus Udaeobacter sp.]|jgi:hypothetical protein|nr:hypothetical protein [Candidatus Udaeobacter sp.]